MNYNSIIIEFIKTIVSKMLNANHDALNDNFWGNQQYNLIASIDSLNFKFQICIDMIPYATHCFRKYLG